MRFAELAKLHCSMDDLPEALLAEIVKRLTSPSDLKSLSLVSKRLYAIEGELRNSMYIGCGVFPVTVTTALARLCFRYPNLCKVEFNYFGWTSNHAMPLDDHGLEVFSSCCPSLTDLTLSFCSDVHDSGLGYLAAFKKLISLRLNTLPAITSSGLLSVAVGCKKLSALHLIGCKRVVGSEKWLEYLGRVGSLEELVVSYCVNISQFDLLKFGPGWTKLQKFEFQIKVIPNVFDPRDPACVEHCQYRYDFSCESLEDLTLARVSTEKEKGLRCLLRKCKALKKLCLYWVVGVQDNDIVMLSNNCSNLTSISLRLTPEFNEGHVFRTSLTDDSLKALALRCRKLQSFELIFWGCDEFYPEIGFTQEGLVMLIQSCPIRNLMLCDAHIFDDEGMKAISSAQFLESLQLTLCGNVTNDGMRHLAHCPCLVSLTLQRCDRLSDAGVTEVARARKLETLVVEGCSRVSLEAVLGVATSAECMVECPSILSVSPLYGADTMHEGKSKMILGFAEGFPTMLKGEIAMFKMHPKIHYAEDDCPVAAPDGFPKDDELQFEIEMLDFFKAKVVAEDLGVVKKIVDEGKGWETPREPYEITARITARTADGKEIIPSKEEAYFFTIGKSEYEGRGWCKR